MDTGNLNKVKIKYEGEDEYYASLVTEKIAAIGTVTEESEAAIKEARASYDALTSAQKKLVTNYDVLDEAELQLEIIKGTAVTTKFYQQVMTFMVHQDMFHTVLGC